jgi:hypothetical protein
MGSFCRKCARLNYGPKDGLDKKLVQNVALGVILIHVQTLDLGKGPVENVLSFPNLNFSLDKENPHRWRCSWGGSTCKRSNQINRRQ